MLAYLDAWIFKANYARFWSYACIIGQHAFVCLQLCSFAKSKLPNSLSTGKLLPRKFNVLTNPQKLEGALIITQCSFTELAHCSTVNDWGELNVLLSEVSSDVESAPCFSWLVYLTRCATVLQSTFFRSVSGSVFGLQQLQLLLSWSREVSSSSTSRDLPKRFLPLSFPWSLSMRSSRNSFL